jgi:hypothetical protein
MPAIAHSKPPPLRHATIPGRVPFVYPRTGTKNMSNEELIAEARSGYSGQEWVKDHHPHSAVGLALRLADALEAAQQPTTEYAIVGAVSGRYIPLSKNDAERVAERGDSRAFTRTVGDWHPLTPPATETENT